MQAATGLLAASVLVAIPAGPAGAAVPAQPRPQPERGKVTAALPRVDPATLRKVVAYRKYRHKVAYQQRRAKRAIRFARKQLGKPYVWGATGPRAYDCSGLVMRAWQKAGVQLPRVTYSQYRQVRRKVGIKSLKPGDLIFFHGRGHVGMYLSKNRFIHAPNSRSRVRIDRLNAYRRSSFAGAVRPGAPAARKWPASIIRLDRILHKRNGHGHPKKGKAAHGGSAMPRPQPRPRHPLGDILNQVTIPKWIE